MTQLEKVATGVKVVTSRENRHEASKRSTSRSRMSVQFGSSYSVFSDPDGNTWLLQEVTTRLPGGIDSGETSFASANDLASALRRAAAAHGEHEKRTGQRDENWPEWYAAHIVEEQAGEELPQ